MNSKSTSILVMLIFLCMTALHSPRSRADNQGQTVLVAGATGSIGRIVIGLLKEQGFQVRAMSRDPQAAAQRFGDGYEWVQGDVRDPAQMQALMQGVDRVICSIGYTEFEGSNGPQFVDYMGVRNLVDAAAEHDVQHFVLISASSAGPWRDHTQNPRFGYVAYWKTKGENHLKASGVPFSIVGPGGFLNEPGGTKGVRIFSREEFRMGYIGREDVAAIAVASLTDPAARNKAFAAQYDDAVAPGEWRGMFTLIRAEP